MAVSVPHIRMDGLSTTSPAAALEQRLLALTGEMLCAVGPDGLVRGANPAWASVLGWTSPELEASAFLDLVAADDRVEAEAALDTGAAGPFECRMRCADGDERTVCWSMDADRGEDAVLLAGRDVSDVRRVEAELQEFVYTASHDLAEPLRMVTSYLELLQRRYEGQLDATADEFIGFAVGGAVRMRELIDDLLTFSRAGSSPLEPARIALGPLLSGVLEGLKRMVDEAGANVDVAEPLPAICGDPALIAQLLRQLLANAVKFRATDRPAVLTVTAAQDDGGVRIDISDNGIGIDPAQHERVFKIFARLHGRDAYEGTGVGLALCRRIAERHGGRVWLESVPGSGTGVHVWLPEA
jgi:PAS domain S-box-containing protein